MMPQIKDTEADLKNDAFILFNVATISSRGLNGWMEKWMDGWKNASVTFSVCLMLEGKQMLRLEKKRAHWNIISLSRLALVWVWLGVLCALSYLTWACGKMLNAERFTLVCGMFIVFPKTVTTQNMQRIFWIHLTVLSTKVSLERSAPRKLDDWWPWGPIREELLQGYVRLTATSLRALACWYALGVKPWHTKTKAFSSVLVLLK